MDLRQLFLKHGEKPVSDREAETLAFVDDASEAAIEFSASLFEPIASVMVFMALASFEEAQGFQSGLFPELDND